MSIEGLLNKLIEKGWKPFNKDIKGFSTLNEFTCGYRGEGTNHLGTIRDIVNKESGLWQFVCENGMIKITEGCNWLFGEMIYYDESHTEKLYKDGNYEYRLIESALKDESELESFILDNIKV